MPSDAVPVIDSFPSTLSKYSPVCHKVQSLSWPVLHFPAVFLCAAKCSVANRIDGRAPKSVQGSDGCRSPCNCWLTETFCANRDGEASYVTVCCTRMSLPYKWKQQTLSIFKLKIKEEWEMTGETWERKSEI